MKRVLCFVTTIAITGAMFFSTSLNSYAASRKGLNLILLPHWSPRSVDNFLSVFKDSSGKCSKGSFREIEFGFLPYEYSPATNYVNARSITNCFRSGGKRVHVNVHLSLQASGSNKDSEISRNAKDFNDNFLRQYNNLVTVSVSPSLEDSGSNNDFSRWANLIASQIDANLIGSVTLQRSLLPGVNGGIPGTCFGNKCFRGSKTEYHGEFNESGTVYSNDGNFVYYPVPASNGNIERYNSLLGYNPSPQYILNDDKDDNFINRTNSAKNVVLLWRPAYNILRRYAQNGQVYYTKDGRDLSDSQTSINSTEQAVLRSFFGI